MKNLATTIMFLSVLVGCSATAIIPAKITYTYPLLEPLECYESKAWIGAVAYIDNGSMELYLPNFESNQRIPKKFTFNATAKEGVWTERKDPTLEANMILNPTDLNNLCKISLKQGMLLVTFPGNTEKYKEMAGKQIWLTSSSGPDEVFMVRGIYWKSKLPFTELAR